MFRGQHADSPLETLPDVQALLLIRHGRWESRLDHFAVDPFAGPHVAPPRRAVPAVILGRQFHGRVLARFDELKARPCAEGMSSKLNVQVDAARSAEGAIDFGALPSS